MSDAPRIVLTVGLPGSGKSSYLQSLGANAISSDEIRRQIADDATDQTINRQVFATIRYLLKQRIELRRPVSYVDATSVTRRARKPFLRLAKQQSCRVEAIWFDVSIAVCRERNGQRARVVPEFVLDHMAARLVPPSIEEGFDFVERITAR